MTKENNLQVINTKGINVKEYNFTPYSIVMLKSNKNGEYISAVNFGHIKNFKSITVLMELLKMQLVENEVSDTLNLGGAIAYKEVNESGETLKKGYTNKVGGYVKKYLNQQTIFVTNGEGIICNAFVSTEVPLKDTYANLSNSKGLIVSYEWLQEKKVTLQHFTDKLYQVAAKASIQLNYFKLVTQKLEVFAELANDTEEKEAV